MGCDDRCFALGSWCVAAWKPRAESAHCSAAVARNSAISSVVPYTHVCMRACVRACTHGRACVRTFGGKQACRRRCELDDKTVMRGEVCEEVSGTARLVHILYTHVCVHVFICVYTRLYTRLHTCLYTCLYTCLNKCPCTCLYAHIPVQMPTRMPIHMPTHMNVQVPICHG